MLLKDKFKNSDEFIKYAEYVSGFDFDDVKVKDWFSKNQDFFLTYTGVMLQLKDFVIGKSK